MGALKRTRQSAPGDLVYTQAGNVLPGQLDTALLRTIETRSNVQK